MFHLYFSTSTSFVPLSLGFYIIFQYYLWYQGIVTLALVNTFSIRFRFVFIFVCEFFFFFSCVSFSWFRSFSSRLMFLSDDYMAIAGNTKSIWLVISIITWLFENFFTLLQFFFSFPLLRFDFRKKNRLFPALWFHFVLLLWFVSRSLSLLLFNLVVLVVPQAILSQSHFSGNWNKGMARKWHFSNSILST